MSGERRGWATVHRSVRLSVGVDQPYDDFRRRYEEAVPQLDPERIRSLLERGGSWKDIVEDSEARAPCGFFIFWKLDTTPVMSLAGHSEKCTEYLMGNHVIAERMFRFDPTVMLYAPLRTLIHTDREGETRFVIDRPSSIFSGFGKPEIDMIGHELDAKLITLLGSLNVDVSEFGG
jgi:hypothetical protein